MIAPYIKLTGRRQRFIGLPVNDLVFWPPRWPHWDRYRRLRSEVFIADCGTRIHSPEDLGRGNPQSEFRNPQLIAALAAREIRAYAAKNRLWKELSLT